MIDNVANKVPESTTRDENSTVCGKKIPTNVHKLCKCQMVPT